MIRGVVNKRVVFCDFDGTITVRDGFVRVCRHFAPEAVERLLPGVMDGTISLREGLIDILETIDSCHYDEMMAFCDDIPIRDGLEGFIDFLAEKGVPFVVISGGLKGLVLRKLGPLAEKVAGVYAPDLDTSGEKMKVVTPFPGERELLAKVDVMGHYPCEESVAIGDGITDFAMAQAASRVFARHQLADYLTQKEVFFHPWGTFGDVHQTLKSLWD